MCRVDTKLLRSIDESFLYSDSSTIFVFDLISANEFIIIVNIHFVRRALLPVKIDFKCVTDV